MTHPITLRPITASDKKLLFSWRNDPWIVALGSLNRQVSWEEHSAWFDRVIASPDWLLLIIQLSAKEDIGLVRFKRENDHAEISIYLLKAYIGKGRGSAALRLACRQAFAHWDIITITATILRHNEASLKSFRNIGFTITNTYSDHYSIALARHDSP